jgi:GTP-binding protein EngB required for normal cell division
MLTPLHKHVLLTGFLDVESRLKQMEALLVQGTRRYPLNEYVGDLSPTETKVVADYFARIRSTMQTCLEKHHIPIEVRPTSLRWAVQCGMTMLDVALADLGPKRLQGYGSIDEAGRQEVQSIQQELTRLTDRVSAYLSERLGHDLPERLARLEAAPGSVAMLSLLNLVVMRWQLVEFRPALDTIVQRLESPQYEIAVFGRVSSGKSSLLNHIAGMDILPVGVTPVTAVPTRLVRGDSSSALVYCAETNPRRIDPDDLVEYASEEKNPGNYKHVTGIIVALPSPRLREGVVLVDTPGIGSLATSGSEETFAYLPRCDLSVVLINAGSNLNDDDLTLLRALYEAGITAQVLLSKADLLKPADRQRVLQYVGEQLRRGLNLELTVHPVSIVGQDAALLDAWFEREIEPLWERHRTLVEKSLHRKIAGLRESVIAVLKTLLAKRRGTYLRNYDGAALKMVERLLDDADAAIERTEAGRRKWSADATAMVAAIVQDAAKALVESSRQGGSTGSSPVGQVVQQTFVQIGQTAREIIINLQRTLIRILESLAKTAPLAAADTASIRNAALAGLPVVDLTPLLANCDCTIPHWAITLPGTAPWMARRIVKNRLAAQLEQYVRLYNTQLQVWLRDTIAQLVEPYRSQAEVFREQLRRMTTLEAESGETADTAQLVADLRELEQAGVTCMT